MPTPDISDSGGGGAIEGKVTRGTVTLANADLVAEKTVADYSPDQFGEIEVKFDLTAPNTDAWNANENGKIITVRLYSMIDATNRVVVDQQTFTIGIETVCPALRRYIARGTNLCRVTIQIDVAVTAPTSYTINYDIIEGGV